jgi:hypothetical protein
MWSVGILIGHLLHGEIDDMFAPIVEEALNHNAHARPTATQLLALPLFADYHPDMHRNLLLGIQRNAASRKSIASSMLRPASFLRSSASSMMTIRASKRLKRATQLHKKPSKLYEPLMEEQDYSILALAQSTWTRIKASIWPVY